MATARPIFRPAPWRIMSVAAVLMLATSGLIARLVYLQIVSHASYAARATNEHFDTAVIPAHRGNLLDANGFPLATSVDTYDIAVDKSLWKSDAVARGSAATLAPLLNQAPDDLLNQIANDGGSGNVVTLARGLDYETGRKIIALGVPGVQAALDSRRVNPEGDLGSQLLGFLGRD
ncbi:MAG: hypothetical protein ACYDCQ_21915, partial [Dehalococcoidia bacterium]